MAKKESTLINMFFTLLIISLIASATLSFVYIKTKSPIEKAIELKKNLAIRKVIPEFNNSPINDYIKFPIKQVIKNDTLIIDSLTIYIGKYNDSIVGYAVETFSNEGFGGKIKLMVGFLPEGTIKSIEVIEHNETPGLGDKMLKSKSNFSIQFEGKNPQNFKIFVKKDGGDVDAITAATITSRAFCDAVNKAYEGFLYAKKQNKF